jgi:hypothetical protein
MPGSRRSPLVGDGLATCPPTPAGTACWCRVPEPFVCAACLKPPNAFSPTPHRSPKRPDMCTGPPNAPLSESHLETSGTTGRCGAPVAKPAVRFASAVGEGAWRALPCGRAPSQCAAETPWRAWSDDRLRPLVGKTRPPLANATRAPVALLSHVKSSGKVGSLPQAKPPA